VVWSFNNLNIDFKNIGQHVDDARSFRTGHAASSIIQTPPLKVELEVSHRVFSINVARVVVGSVVVLQLTFFFFLFFSLFSFTKNTCHFICFFHKIWCLFFQFLFEFFLFLFILINYFF
jgi:hypothetical protein